MTENDKSPERYSYLGGEYWLIKLIFWTGVILFEVSAVLTLALGLNPRMSLLNAPLVLGIMIAFDAVILVFMRWIETDDTH